jgi:RimJ/RimL family protein N-acetyltransferase
LFGQTMMVLIESLSSTVVPPRVPVAVAPLGSLKGLARCLVSTPGGHRVEVMASTELRVPDPPLADGVVALRAFTPDDIGWVTEACSDPAIPRFTLVPEPYEAAHAREWIDGLPGERARRDALQLAITAAEGGEPLGAVGLLRLSWPHARGEIGYWVAPWARGRGVARRAVRLLARHAFDALGLQRIEIVPYVDNPASQRVAEKAGARREGVLRSYFLARGVRHDCVMYALLPEDLA